MKYKGLQLYSFQKEMLSDPRKTLELIASLGFDQIESANSAKGKYYGLSPKEMKSYCNELGMTLRSGHVQIDQNWSKTVNEAAISGQEYLICSDMPIKEQTIENYKRVSDIFNKVGEECKKFNILFGYHNHGFEFDIDKGQTLDDVLLNNTDPKTVFMELDLGWVIVAGKKPLDYLLNHEGRFPIWHLKDMNIGTMQSTEFGKGDLNIPEILKYGLSTEVNYLFLEQEEFQVNAFESMKHNIEYIKKIMN